MNNQQSRPIVAPEDYQRNRHQIAEYRSYIDFCERMNEQGLQNHKVFERAEHMLQERIRQGEEAR